MWNAHIGKSALRTINSQVHLVNSSYWKFPAHLRALETCTLIAKANEHLSAGGAPILKSELLRERAFGKYEGRVFKEYLSDMKHLTEGGAVDIWDLKPEGGESPEDVMIRIESFMKVEM